MNGTLAIMRRELLTRREGLKREFESLLDPVPVGEDS